MRCPNCGYEGESRFCPECGTPLAEMPLTKTAPAEAPAEEPRGAEEPVREVIGEKVPPEGKRHSVKKWVIVVIIAVAAVLVAAIIGCTVIFKELAKSEYASEPTTSSYEEDIEDFDIEEEPDGEGVGEVAQQGKELPGGNYTVGEDIAPGKYNFTYKTEMSEDDYWTNDYFYITRAGSEGTEETLGGTKFDERFGSVDYDSAVKGKTFYANLKKGDKLEVNSEFGNWTY